MGRRQGKNGDHCEQSQRHTAPPDLHPSLAPLHEAIVIASGILTDERYAALRPVLSTTALREVIKNAEKLIGELQGGQS